jgi:KDO2-lipid IV(A) lauroyltransferase
MSTREWSLRLSEGRALPSAPRTPASWPSWLGLWLLRLAARLPWPGARALGRALGTLAQRTLHSRRRAAATNLRLCFPELSDREREALLHAHFQELGIGVFETVRAWWATDRQLAPFFASTHIEGLEHLHALAREPRGALLVSGHFVNMEFCARLLTPHLRFAGMYQRYHNRVFERAIKQGRLRHTVAMFDNTEIRAAVRHLKRGGVLWYAPDQDMRGKDTVFAPFFGIPAATITATHQLARLSGCAVVPFFHRREVEGGRDVYHMRLGEPLANFPSADAATDTARVNAEVEAMARAAPAQYLWIHRRFKRQPDGSSPYR